MTRDDLLTGLEATGYPVTYRAFKSVQPPPFICYLFTSSADLMADDSNYAPVGLFAVELYSRDKDPTFEAAVESELAALGLTWAKSETYLDAETMNFVLYEVQVALQEPQVS